ncbi:ATP-binding protein [Streptacidiphilus sp. ASG 303]|uniref:ATP-binding protein n=1 Tax=Streptacidiphilus sp. ASG 303 TaxID=2896847 RepID=UPI001E4EEEC8|nr:ATP-binding protein [Streptacidiphilus sp. ASG 303]MCD0483691.1 ATP-binding protein [Streptacidiphilus sp. ASG 303]
MDSVQPHTSGGPPLRARFDGSPGTVGEARRLAAEHLAAAGAGPHDAERVLLVVSELVTNAVRHAPGPCVLTVDAGPGAVRVAVQDTSPVRPDPRPADLSTGTGGFGMHLVAQLSRRLTVEDAAHGTGKSVVAVVDTGPA